MNLELTEYQQMLYDGYVEDAKAYKLGKKTTACLITLYNGFEIVGTSACVNPDKFDMAIGGHYALVDALDQLDNFAGFMLQEIEFDKKQREIGE